MIHLFLADGFEELEAITVLDIIRRARLPIATVSITANRHVIGSHGISVKADMLFRKKDLRDSDMLIVPGGLTGVRNLSFHDGVKKRFEDQSNQKKPIAAICAGPVFLEKCNILSGKNITCYPGLESEFKEVNISKENVVVDGNLITAKGPAAALPFAFSILKFFIDEDAINQVKSGMLFDF